MSDSDKQKAIVSLTFVSQTCTAALAALSAFPRTEDDSSDQGTINLSVILKDLDSLLALIYNLTTKLSLSLKPSAPSYSASLPVLQDLAKHTSGVVYCVDLLRAKPHGATLIKDTAYVLRGIIESIRALVQTFLHHAARSPHPSSSGIASEEYLTRTGTVHELITRARSTSGIPKDNQSAVKQHWRSNQDSLKDNLHEVDRMIEEAGNVNGSEVEDEIDDGWDELGLDHFGKMQEDELARAKNVRQILRLTNLLHERILLDLLSSSLAGPVPNSVFDVMLVQSNLLLATSDDLATTLYTPQEPNSVRQECINLTKVAKCIRNELHVFFLPTALNEQLRRLNIKNTPADSTVLKAKSKVERWFDTCFEQIFKLSSTLHEQVDVVRGK